MTELAKRLKHINFTEGEYKYCGYIVKCHRFINQMYQIGLIDKEQADDVYRILDQALVKAEKLK